jgi:hypothetical protein
MGIASVLHYVNNMQRSGDFQSFTVYNDGQGNFVATAVQECTPGPDQVALFTLVSANFRATSCSCFGVD